MLGAIVSLEDVTKAEIDHRIAAAWREFRAKKRLLLNRSVSILWLNARLLWAGLPAAGVSLLAASETGSGFSNAPGNAFSHGSACETHAFQKKSAGCASATSMDTGSRWEIWRWCRH